MIEPQNKELLPQPQVMPPLRKRCVVWVAGRQCPGWREHGSNYCWFHRPRKAAA